MRHFIAFALLCTSPLTAFAQHNQGRYTDSNGLEWEDPVPEIIAPEMAPSDPVDIEDEGQFDGDQSPEHRQASEQDLTKKRVDQFLAPSCDQIVAVKDKFPKEEITRTTQYFVPLFPAGNDGGLQKQDRRACINVEGSCVVEKFLYNWTQNGSPWGQRYLRGNVAFQFGKGSGQSYYNSTNALDPCRTVAADPALYPTGTVIYVPSLRGKLCPQNQKEVDGCFVVGDVGSAIKGAGRFDLFVGECARYDKKTNSCRDRSMDGFTANKGDSFYVIRQHNILAKTLREDADLMINSNWISNIIH